MYIYIHTLYYYKLFLYFNLCLNILLDILSYSFTSTSFISTSWSFTLICIEVLSRLVIGTSRTVGSAKKFVRITSGFGGGEFTKTLRKVCTCQKLKFSFLLLVYCKIRECYAVVNAFTIRNMHSLFLYMKCNSQNQSSHEKHDENCDTLTFLSCSRQRCKLNFQYFFIMGV